MAEAGVGLATTPYNPLPLGVEEDATDSGTLFMHDVERLMGIVPHTGLPSPARRLLFLERGVPAARVRYRGGPYLAPGRKTDRLRPAWVYGHLSAHGCPREDLRCEGRGVGHVGRRTRQVQWVE